MVATLKVSHAIITIQSKPAHEAKRGWLLFLVGIVCNNTHSELSILVYVLYMDREGIHMLAYTF